MGRRFGRGVLVQVPDVLSCLEMGDEIEQAGEPEGDDPDLGQGRQRTSLTAEPFYRKHTLVIQRSAGEVKGLHKYGLVLDYAHAD